MACLSATSTEGYRGFPPDWDSIQALEIFAGSHASEVSVFLSVRLASLGATRGELRVVTRDPEESLDFGFEATTEPRDRLFSGCLVVPGGPQWLQVQVRALEGDEIRIDHQTVTVLT